MTSLSLLCVLSLTSPPDSQKSPLIYPYARPNLKPPASPTLFQPSLPPPAPIHAGGRVGTEARSLGLGTPGCMGERICPEPHWQAWLSPQPCKPGPASQRQALLSWLGLTFTPSFFLFPPLFPPAEEKK